MKTSREETLRTLKRLLANGPLTNVPIKPADQQVLVTLAAAQFAAGKIHGEGEVNEILKTWIATFCEPYAIDHVTLRRLAVDSRLLSRTKSGSTYEVNPERTNEIDSVKNIEPARVLAEVRAERESRKRRHAA
jgi:hypothetical protein